MTNGLKCIGVKTIDELKYSPQVFEDGAIAYTDDKKVYCYVNNKWEEVSDYGTVDKIDDTKANLNLNLYDLNKSLVRSLPDPDTDTLGDYQQKINSYHRKMNNNYYLMLCRDYNYYTVYHYEPKIIADSFGKSVLDCLADVGKIKTLDWNEEQGAIEIWMSINDNIYMFYLFGYDAGVVDFS